ncbi:SmORF protein [Babesia bovis T2Bo]|uniref:SmORF n=1 Tax=Babesia bovis TaxID=5865 RepID=A7ATC3_BABBO|nr:SmORF protein [Babesia bovis T2Bo]EDO06184.1 SmORF protein [Babesia bovis T2Bo]|eukprot:XP_001609752.1 SmORF [Babesia bovis]
MVSFNTFSKLCVVVALGLSAIATSTEVAQEQPKKESFVSRFFGKNEKSATKSHDVSEPTKIDTQKHSDTGHPKYDVEWYLLPKPENRAALRGILSWFMARDVPEDCNVPISPKLEKRIREHFSWIEQKTVIHSSSADSNSINVGNPMKKSIVNGPSGKKEEPTTESHDISQPTNTDTQENINEEEPPMYSVEWHLLPKPENRAAIRVFMPRYLAEDVPKDCSVPVSPKLEKRIREHFSLHGIEWFMLPKPQNRAALCKALPSDLAEMVPEDCNEPIMTIVQRQIIWFFSFYAVEWYLLPEPESRAALRFMLPSNLAAMVPEDCDEPIDPALEKRIVKYFTLNGLNPKLWSRLSCGFHW